MIASVGCRAPTGKRLPGKNRKYVYNSIFVNGKAFWVPGSVAERHSFRIICNRRIVYVFTEWYTHTYHTLNTGKWLCARISICCARCFLQCRVSLSWTHLGTQQCVLYINTKHKNSAYRKCVWFIYLIFMSICACIRYWAYISIRKRLPSVLW